MRMHARMRAHVHNNINYNIEQDISPRQSSSTDIV